MGGIFILSIVCGIITGCGLALMIMGVGLSNSNKMGDSTGGKWNYQKEPTSVIQIKEW